MQIQRQDINAVEIAILWYIQLLLYKIMRFMILIIQPTLVCIQYVSCSDLLFDMISFITWYHYWSHFLIYPLQSWAELHFGSEHCGWLTELPPILWLPIRILSPVLKEGIRQTLDSLAELRLSRTEPTGKSSSAGLLLRGYSLLICGQSRKQQCRTNTNTGKMAYLEIK